MTQRKALLTRFLIGISIGLLIAIPLSELAFYFQGNNTSRPPKTITIDIPAGTAQKVSQGQSVLPQDLTFVVGDILVVNNHDSIAHTLGPLFIPPNASARMALDHLGGFSFVCSFQPTRYQGLDVQEALTTATRIEGIVIAGIPLGILLALYSLILRPLKFGKNTPPPGTA
ncbi:MAG TPA: hypothetical protein VMC09_06970 [Anaerolineales bacterium]|nr:hypothetical protein [Anaerolineales bacterium]